MTTARHIDGKSSLIVIDGWCIIVDLGDDRNSGSLHQVADRRL